MRTFARFRKAVGRGTAALRAPLVPRRAVPAIEDAAEDAPTSPGSVPDGVYADPPSATGGAGGDRTRALALARDLLASGQEAQALQLVQAWIQRAPGDVDFRRVAGSAQKALRWLEDAAASFEFVLGVRGRDGEILRALGEIYDGLGQTTDAIARWQMLVELTEGGDDGALTALGIDLSRVGEHTRAVAMLETVVSRHPDSSAAFADLGMALLEGGRVNEAVRAFSSARALDPMSAQAHCGLGLAYQGLERWHEATDAFAETERLAPESAVGPFNLGLTLARLGDGTGMRNALLRAASIEPDDREIRAALQRLLITPEKGEVDAGTEEPTLSASMSGSLKTFHLLDLLEFLRIQAKTGTLVITSRSGVGTIALLRGDVVLVSAPGTKPLDEELAERRLVNRAALDAHWTAPQSGQNASGDILGAALCRAGLLVPEQLHQVFLERAIAGLEELYEWEEGTFSFHPGDQNESRKSRFPIVFEMQRLVLEMLRRVEEHVEERAPVPDPDDDARTESC